MFVNSDQMKPNKARLSGLREQQILSGSEAIDLENELDSYDVEANAKSIAQSTSAYMKKLQKKEEERHAFWVQIMEAKDTSSREKARHNWDLAGTLVRTSASPAVKKLPRLIKQYAAEIKKEKERMEKEKNRDVTVINNDVIVNSTYDWTKTTGWNS